LAFNVNNYVKMGQEWVIGVSDNDNVDFTQFSHSTNILGICRTGLPILFFCLPLLLAGFSAAASSSWHAGPLFDQFELTLDSGHRTEAVGPLFYIEQKETMHTWAIPPLITYAQDPAVGLRELDFVYPVISFDWYGDQFRWQFFQLLSFAGGESGTETNRNRFTLFPVYFQQRSSDPAENYTALFPFYGHLKNRLFRSEVFWVMWPLYCQTRKRDVITDNYLVPFFHLRHGDGLEGWQLWPLMGREQKSVTTKTNSFGDMESVPGHRNLFVLWPIFYNERAGIGSDNPDWQQGMLPFYSFQRSPQRDSTTVIWPFFSRIHDREKKYEEWDAPWPFIEFAHGEGKNAARVWPFYSHVRSPTLQNGFLMWPIYKYEGITSAPLERHRDRIVFYLYNDIREKNTETGLSQRRIDLWPLFTSRRRFDGSTRLQIFAPLEIFTAGSHKIERDYSPLWSVWRSERNAKTGASSHSLLWNLYRHESAPERKRVSALFGLFDYQAEGKKRRWRIAYIPFGSKMRSKETTMAAGAKSDK